ncbi:MAG: chloramphenicol phosphotransferase [Anaerolineae bacterium]|nr:MAG: chloramphenicol phosphotransferase [Anaerolineae bacterium]
MNSPAPIATNETTILILNGASSSGKTSLVKALQKTLDAPYLDAGLDRFLWMLPPRYLDRPLWDEVLGLATQAGDVGNRLVRGMHRSIAALATAGNNVVADHVLVEPAWLADCATLFAGMRAYLIGVHCPLDVLEERERSRKDRTLGQAKAQYDIVHRGAVYDIELDTHTLSPEACAEFIKEKLDRGLRPMAFQMLRDTQ